MLVKKHLLIFPKKKFTCTFQAVHFGSVVQKIYIIHKFSIDDSDKLGERGSKNIQNAMRFLYQS